MCLHADSQPTSAWSLDVARLLDIHGINRFRVHGFDISDEQFPPAHILPDNLKLSVADALGSVPENLRGSFDIVHIAHFAGVRALGEDPGPVIQYALALLSNYPLPPPVVRLLTYYLSWA